MTPQELEVIGLRLYGLAWRSRLAETLGSDRSRVSRWARGERPIPGVAAKRIRELAEVDSERPKKK